MMDREHMKKRLSFVKSQAINPDDKIYHLTMVLEAIVDIVIPEEIVDEDEFAQASMGDRANY